MAKKKVQVRGECPACGSMDTNFNPGDKDVMWDDDRLYVPFSCNECGCSGAEVYLCQYIETEYEKSKKRG